MSRIFLFLVMLGLAFIINTLAVDANSHDHMSHAELSDLNDNCEVL